MTLDKILLNQLLLIKMKNLGKIVLVVSFLFLSVLPVLAINEPKVSPLREEVREETSQGTESALIKAARQGSEGKVATIAGKLDARKKEIIKNYFGLMIRRSEAAINRLSKIIVRIESRIGKIEETDKKIKLTVAKQQLAKAKESLNQNGLQIKEIQTQMATIMEEDSTKESFAEVKTMINDLKKSLLETRKILTKIIGDIKGLKVGQTATPSAAIKEVE